MPALTQLLALTGLLRLSSVEDANAPENTPSVELRTEDGVFLATENNTLIGVTA